MHIPVYLGANRGNDPALERAVRELGRWIGTSGNARSTAGPKPVLWAAWPGASWKPAARSPVWEPQFFMDAGYQYDGLTRLIVTEDMARRKAKMIELGDAFIAFPGGTGTLEEIAEVMSQVSLKQLKAPCILYNLNGYYDHLKALLEHMIEKDLSSPDRQQGIHFAADLAEIQEILRQA